jgi:hypothetical protein
LAAAANRIARALGELFQHVPAEKTDGETRGHWDAVKKTKDQGRLIIQILF